MRDCVPEMKYAFADTGGQVPETYEYLDKLVTSWLMDTLSSLANSRAA